MNLEPLVGALTGVVAFSDAFGPAQLAAGTAILVGIGLGAMPRLPVDRPAVAEEAAGRAVAGSVAAQTIAGRAVPHRPAAAGPPMSVATQPGQPRSRARRGGQRVREHQRHRVERSLRD